MFSEMDNGSRQSTPRLSIDEEAIQEQLAQIYHDRPHKLDSNDSLSPLDYEGSKAFQVDKSIPREVRYPELFPEPSDFDLPEEATKLGISGAVMKSIIDEIEQWETYSQTHKDVQNLSSKTRVKPMARSSVTVAGREKSNDRGITESVTNKTLRHSPNSSLQSLDGGSWLNRGSVQSTASQWAPSRRYDGNLRRDFTSSSQPRDMNAAQSESGWLNNGRLSELMRILNEYDDEPFNSVNFELEMNRGKTGQSFRRSQSATRSPRRPRQEPIPEEGYPSSQENFRRDFKKAVSSRDMKPAQLESGWLNNGRLSELMRILNEYDATFNSERLQLERNRRKVRQSFKRSQSATKPSRAGTQEPIPEEDIELNPSHDSDSAKVRNHKKIGFIDWIKSKIHRPLHASPLGYDRSMDLPETFDSELENPQSKEDHQDKLTEFKRRTESELENFWTAPEGRRDDQAVHFGSSSDQRSTRSVHLVGNDERKMSRDSMTQVWSSFQCFTSN